MRKRPTRLRVDHWRERARGTHETAVRRLVQTYNARYTGNHLAFFRKRSVEMIIRA
jgi:hypothetical protein